MKPSTIHLLYRTITWLFAALLLMAGITEAIAHESGKEIMRHLGYPEHVLHVLGAGKILAAVALVQRRFPTLREWAYAGVTFNLLGAFVARAAAGDSAGLILSPLIFLAVMFGSYFLGKKAERSGRREAQQPLHQPFASGPAVKVA
ncbi:MAG: DoxX family protein [Cytophagales bacterium]|nr:DoxX family protein [Cytophagales bacterium]